MVKESSFGTPNRLLPCLLTLSLLMTPIVVFPDYFSLNILGGYLLPLEKKTNFIKTCAKLLVKQANCFAVYVYSIVAAQQTSKAKLSKFAHSFSKAVRALSVNERKLTLRNAFIVNLFGLESEKESKYD